MTKWEKELRNNMNKPWPEFVDWFNSLFEEKPFIIPVMDTEQGIILQTIDKIADEHQ